MIPAYYFAPEKKMFIMDTVSYHFMKNQIKENH